MFKTGYLKVDDKLSLPKQITPLKRGQSWETKTLVKIRTTPSPQTMLVMASKAEARSQHI